MIFSQLPRFGFGGDYNPEQWPESVWLEDMRLMREAGVNLVSVAIFSWAKLNPAPGVYTFEWLDRVMNLLAENGIYACLATATASPPHWLCLAHPEILPVDREGIAYQPGSRRHYTPNSPIFREQAAALTRALAERYRGHPALAGWHIDNELTCHLAESHTPADQAAFRAWLQARYGTLDALNAAWSTTFWSQTYLAWNEVQSPRRTPGQNNPGAMLDWRRFTSDSYIGFYRLLADIVREVTPGVPVTTNTMGFHLDYDGFASGKEQDFAALDSYPDTAAPGFEAPMAGAAAQDITRAMKAGAPWVLMEQAPGAVNWRPLNRLKQPGVMRLWSLQAVARGAEAVMYFQWRQSRGGGEKWHSACVPHGPVEQSRVFAEVRQLGAELQRLNPILGTRVQAQVGLLFDWESAWALNLPEKPRRMDANALVMEWQKALWQEGISADFLHPAFDYAAYRVIIVPHLYLLRENTAQRLEAFAAAGGTVIVGCYSGLVDENERAILGGYPGYLRNLLGLTIEEHEPLPDEVPNALRLADGTGELGCGFLVELLQVTTARPLATFARDWFAGRIGLTVNTFGHGRAYYVATRLDRPSLRQWLRSTLAEAGVRPVLAVPEGVEVVLRAAADGRRFLFLLNHHTDAVTVALGDLAGRDLLTDTDVAGSLTLTPRGVAVVALA